MAYNPNNPNGQATMANSAPVVIASNQSAVPVSLSTVAVTNAGTFVVQENGAALTSLQLIDDTVYASDAAISKVLGIGAQFDDTAPGTTTENSVRSLRMSTRRELYVQLRDAAGNERGLNIDASGQLAITVASIPSHAVTNAGTFVVQENGAALTSLQLIDDAIVADDAVFTPATTKVMMAGFEFDDVTPDSVNEGDGGAARMSANRNQYVQIRDNAGNERGLNIDASGQLAVTIASAQTLATVTTVTTVSALGVGTTGPQKAEDVASAGGDMGIAAYAVRLDTPVSGANVSADGDYLPLITDSFGKLWTAGSYAEDVASANADIVNVAGAKRLDTPVANANVSADGDYLPFIADNFGKIWTTGSVPEDTAHVAGEALTVNGVRRIDTAATSAGTSGDWATMDASAEGAIWATLTPTTTSGLSVANFTSGDTYTALTSTAQVIKASAGNLYGYYIYNPNATAAYVMVYNIAAASVTVGTSTALLVFAIPATAGANLTFPYPISFSNAGWSAAATTTGGGNTAPGTALEAMFFYK